jgi:adenylate kinase
MLDKVETPLERCVALTVDTEAVVQRLLKRAEFEGRADDNEETIRERMRVYDAQTAPLLEFYKGKDILREVDGMGTMEEVSARVETALSGS